MATLPAVITTVTDPSQYFQKDLQQINSTLATGVINLIEYLTQDLTAYEKEVLNIAVVGSSGHGKSTFINTIRRLKPLENGAAEVGVKETTKTIQKYNDPHNANFIYWDLPGCGTSNFTRDQYIKLVKLDTYDFFVILSKSRFTEEDGWLVKKVAELGKCFYFVRTHIDEDIKNERKAHPEKRQSDVLRDIRKNCLEELDKLDLKITLQFRIFLIGAKYAHYTKWDFPKLISSLLNDCSGLKKQALLMTMTANSKEAIHQKVEMLRSRIWKVATLSAGIAAIPIPGTSIMADAIMMTKEADKYRKQLNLDSDSLDKLAKTHGITRQMIYDKLSLGENFDLSLLKNLGGFIIKLLVFYAAAEMGEELARMIPFVGWLIAGTISFYTMYKVLHDILDKMENASLALMDYLLSRNSELDMVEDEDDDLPSEIHETLETNRHEVFIQPTKTVEPLPRSVISVVSPVTVPMPTAEVSKKNSASNVHSSKSCWCCCFRR